MNIIPLSSPAVLLSALLFFPFTSNILAQSQSANDWTATIGNHYIVHPDEVYGFQDNISLKLDVWEPKDNDKPLPTVIYIHGGGWFFGDGTGATPQLLPVAYDRIWRFLNANVPALKVPASAK